MEAECFLEHIRHAKCRIQKDFSASKIFFSARKFFFSGGEIFFSGGKKFFVAEKLLAHTNGILTLCNL